MKVSRQRAYQIRLRSEGRCTVCGEPAAPSTRKNAVGGMSTYCIKHREAFREYQRERNGAKRRNMRADSYKSDEIKSIAKVAGS
jgi:hypothetical protein